MNVIKIFGLGVIMLEFIVANRPSRRDSAVMLQLAEVFFAEAKQSRAIKLCVSPNVVVGMRMQVFAVLIEPALFCVVVPVHIDDLRVPVAFFARHVSATLQN